MVPAGLEGRRILDLGSGSGRDVYLMAQLVGDNGEVVGVDMTDEQLATANAHVDWHRERFGYKRANVKFLKGYIEKLDELGLEPQSFDVVVSNCVINLSVDKLAVLRGALNLLKPGGELYFADVYCDRRLPDSVRNDPVLYGECLGGALYWNDFLPMAKQAGFLDPRLVTSKPIEVTNEVLRKKLGQAQFFSATYRLFKLDGLESACEDYGQAVIYKGSVPEQPDGFELDGHHLHRARQSVSGLRQYLAHAGGYALQTAFRFHRRFLHALRHLPGLRHVDPVRDERGGGAEQRELLLTLSGRSGEGEQ